MGTVVRVPISDVSVSVLILSSNVKGVLIYLLQKSFFHIPCAPLESL